MNYVYAEVRFYFDLQTAPVTPKPVDLAPGETSSSAPATTR